jgi:hypothetical protein
MRSLIVLSLLFYQSLFLAQIINIEDKRLGIEEDGWRGNIDLNFRFTQNGTSVWQINNRISIQHKKDKNTHLILGDMNVVRSNTSDLINFGYIHYRFSHLIEKNPDIHIEGFTQSQYNTVQKIKLRSLIGGGLKIKVLGSDTINLNLGWTFFYEYEEVTTPEYSNVIRNSNFVSFNWKIHRSWDLKTILYYQPNIADFRDYRLSNETSISHRFNEHFSIIGNLSFLFDSKPPIEVPVNIFNSSLALRYKF